MNLSSFWLAIGALVPSAGVGFFFFIIIKAMIEGDRRERLAHSQWEAQQQSNQRTTAAPPKGLEQPTQADAESS